MSKPKTYKMTIVVTHEEILAFDYVVMRANDVDHDWHKSDPHNPQTKEALVQVDKADELYRRLRALADGLN